MKETAPIRTINTKNGESQLKRINLVDTTQQSLELTGWGQQAIFLEEADEDLKQDCIVAVRMVQVSKHDTYGVRMQTRESTKIILVNKMSPQERAPFNEIVNNLMNMYGGGKNMEGMKSLGGGGGAKAPSVSIEILCSEINGNHPDMVATWTRESDGRQFITGLRRTLTGTVTWIKQPSSYNDSITFPW